MLFVQGKGYQPIKHKKNKCISKASPIIPEKRLPHPIERQGCPLKFTKYLAGNLAEYINRQRVYTDNQKRKSPSRLLRIVNHVNECSENKRSGTTGHQNETGRPQSLVQRVSVTPQIPYDKHQRTPNSQFHNLQTNLLFAYNDFPTKESNHHLCHSGYCTQYPFWVDKLRTAQLHMRLTQHGIIDNRDYILGAFLESVSKKLQ